MRGLELTSSGSPDPSPSATRVEVVGPSTTGKEGPVWLGACLSGRGVCRREWASRVGAPGHGELSEAFWEPAGVRTLRSAPETLHGAEL